MPSIFKKLVDISVWILFVLGCIALILGIAQLTIGVPTPPVPARGVPVPGVWSTQFWGLGGFSLFLSVVAAWFRKVIG